LSWLTPKSFMGKELLPLDGWLFVFLQVDLFSSITILVEVIPLKEY
jgi:hypothetical protein